MKDKTLRIVPPQGDRKQLFDEVHAGVWGGHLKDAKIHGELAKQYLWPGMRSDIIKWCQACLVCASRQVGQTVCPPLTSIPLDNLTVWERMSFDFPSLQKGISMQWCLWTI